MAYSVETGKTREENLFRPRPDGNRMTEEEYRARIARIENGGEGVSYLDFKSRIDECLKAELNK